jgi:diaminopimelate decarboxylase
MHTGSEIKDTNVFIAGLDIMFEMVNHFPDIEFIDLGSGFKVPYFEDDVRTDIRDLGKRLAEAFAKFEKENNRSLEIWFEPGKFLVSEAGYFVVKANVVKQTTATVFAGVEQRFQSFDTTNVL